jgi:hypothetical protein
MTLDHTIWAPIPADRRRRAHGPPPARPTDEALGVDCRWPSRAGTRRGRAPRLPTGQACGTHRRALKSALAHGRPSRPTRSDHPPAPSSIRPEIARYVSRIRLFATAEPTAHRFTLCLPCTTGHAKPAGPDMRRQSEYARYVSRIFSRAAAVHLETADHFRAVRVSYAIRNAYHAAITRTAGRRRRLSPDVAGLLRQTAPSACLSGCHARLRRGASGKQAMRTAYVVLGAATGRALHPPMRTGNEACALGCTGRGARSA